VLGLRFQHALSFRGPRRALGSGVYWLDHSHVFEPCHELLENLLGVLEFFLVGRRRGAVGELFGYAPERRILDLLTLGSHAP